MNSDQSSCPHKQQNTVNSLTVIGIRQNGSNFTLEKKLVIVDVWFIPKSDEFDIQMVLDSSTLCCDIDTKTTRTCFNQGFILPVLCSLHYDLFSVLTSNSGSSSRCPVPCTMICSLYSLLTVAHPSGALSPAL